MKTLSLRKQASNLVLAVALATGTAMIAGHIVPDEAHAQRKKKDKKEKKAKAEYSKEWLAVFQPLDEELRAEGADVAAARPKIDQLFTVTSSPDEQLQTGQLAFNAGTKLGDTELRLKGIEMMIKSDRVPAENIGQYNFIAYQLANNLSQFDKSRTYLQAAIDKNFTTETISASDLQISMAESYFSANQFKQGLDYLEQAIESRKQQGLPIDETWYKRGVTIAYNNEIVPEIYDISLKWVADFPSATNWRDAINLARNLNEFGPQEMLDLFRLGNRVDALTDKQDYIIYVESADARRLPKEVKDIIEQGYASGVVSRDDIYISDSLATANGRIESDRADLPALEQDAKAADAGLRTVVAAGSAFLSYGDYAKAEMFYQKALGMAGVERDEALTRLGIAQIGLGKYDAAMETFNQVSGNRLPIAKLWAGYAMQNSASADAAPAAEPAAEPAEQMGG